MKKFFCLLLLSVVLFSASGMERFVLQRKSMNGKGMTGLLDGRKRLVLLSGTPEEMGTAHGELLKNEIHGMYERILIASAGYLVHKNDWFFTRIDEVMTRTKPFTPQRFMVECDAMSAAAGIPAVEGRQLNFFPEMFHCSGVAAGRSATVNGEIIHARVLDYMRELELHDYAACYIFMPDGFHAWASIGYAGLVGTVTAMNEAGLAMGEMGGGGEGKWDGLPMSFLMRRVMEECATVEEALALMKSVPLTCDYYYVLSDRSGAMAGVAAIAGTPLRIFEPGHDTAELPGAPKDTVYMSGGERAVNLQRLLAENHGKITPEKMLEIIKYPVAMNSNLHNAVFLPESGVIYFADSSKEKRACDMPYSRLDLNAALAYFRQQLAANTTPGK